MTRIIGGVAGGRRITVPPRGTRPTTDRVRESLFNIVTTRRDLTGLAVLDLYAGSGALGLEALSRGAVSALFVESAPRTAAAIARNIEALALPGAMLRRGVVAAVLADGTGSPVDLVLADPPYDVDGAEVQAVVAALGDHGWVRSGSLAVIERAAAGAVLTWPDGWTPWPPRMYGDTRLELAEFG
ncbi:16S rRNA (guanine(966)-N(2))-methyltransferase RsmD [Mycobacterium tilburgii]|uniref:16S rRNA (guanine(966)-N(2))-methyltransferase RsmD n=1 Tax=Mycobacterium tilburgii TaxID=44467 RepID=UPI00118408AF|nr:16S rRNA (guanine(966)-N(2))-methyltransferase RsmD [Mycobacterium tilburgii]